LVKRLRKEKETYRDMVESFQKGSRKKQSGNPASSSEDESEASSTNTKQVINNNNNSNNNLVFKDVKRLKFKLQTMEEELSEAKLESSRAKSALETEKTNGDIALNELRSRINELEEAGELIHINRN